MATGAGEKNDDISLSRISPDYATRSLIFQFNELPANSRRYEASKMEMMMKTSRKMMTTSAALPSGWLSRLVRLRLNLPALSMTDLNMLCNPPELTGMPRTHLFLPKLSRPLSIYTSLRAR